MKISKVLNSICAAAVGMAMFGMIVMTMLGPSTDPLDAELFPVESAVASCWPWSSRETCRNKAMEVCLKNEVPDYPGSCPETVEAALRSDFDSPVDSDS